MSMGKKSATTVAVAVFSLLVNVAALAAESSAARLQGGTHFDLELAHHITSGQTAAGSPIYFRVVDDVKSQDSVLIRKGTVVEGRMQATGDRKMNATSGTMNFGVRYVPAVDGQTVRVIATVSRAGRDRDGALLGWVVMWGFFGLMTKGVDAYAMRGAVLDAEVLSDRLVVPTVASLGDPSQENQGAAGDARSVTATEHRLGTETNRPVVVSLERARKFADVFFGLPNGITLQSAVLTAVNGTAVPESVPASSIASSALSFPTWDIVKYCDDGANKLLIRGKSTDGEWLAIDYSLPVKLERKVVKK